MSRSASRLLILFIALIFTLFEITGNMAFGSQLSCILSPYAHKLKMN